MDVPSTPTPSPATQVGRQPCNSRDVAGSHRRTVPSVLVELGYVSNKGDMGNLVSEAWRSRTADAMARAIDAFLAKRIANAGGERPEKPAPARAKP